MDGRIVSIGPSISGELTVNVRWETSDSDEADALKARLREGGLQDVSVGFARHADEVDEVDDEEIAWHSFDARTAADDEVWCTGCEYHRDHEIHRKKLHT